MGMSERHKPVKGAPNDQSQGQGEQENKLVLEHISRYEISIYESILM